MPARSVPRLSHMDIFFFLPGETWEVSFGAERITIPSKKPLLVRKKGREAKEGKEKTGGREGGRLPVVAVRRCVCTALNHHVSSRWWR